MICITTVHHIEIISQVSELWIVMWKEMVSGVYGNWKMKMYIDGQRLSDITFGGNVILPSLPSVEILPPSLLSNFILLDIFYIAISQSFI